MKYCIQKAPIGIVIDTLRNPDNSVMEFDSVDQAVTYLNEMAATANGVDIRAFSKWDAANWADDGIYINPIES